jgi:phage terminase Nu1 subunit (DNA packaging protein)
MGEVGKLWVVLGLKTDLANSTAKEIRKVEGELRGVSKVTNTMLTAGKALTLGLTLPIGAAAISMGRLASSAIETENLFNVSVGGMKGQFDSFTASLSKGLGLNRYEIMQTAGMFNVMLTSMGFANQKAYEMSTAITQLSYDMASFYNLPMDEAIQKLQSGLAGEVEPLRRLGIMVDEATVKSYAYANGIATQGKELTANEKVLARYGVIMDATSKAQGDLARTADSPANAMRRLGQTMAQAGADIGKIFMPAVGKGASALAELTGVLANSPAAIKGFVVGVSGILAIAGPTILALYGIRKAIRDVTVAMPALGAALPWVGIAALVAGAVVGIASAVKEHNDQLAVNKQRTADLSTQLTAIRTQMDGANVSQETRNTLAEQEKTLLGELSKLLPATIGQRNAEGEIISLTTAELEAHNEELRKEAIAHNEARKAALAQEVAELKLARAQAQQRAEENARMNAGPVSVEDQTIIEDYTRQIIAAEGEASKLTAIIDELVAPKKKPPKTPGTGDGTGTAMTALDRLRLAFDQAQASGELFRVEMGLIEGTSDEARFKTEQLRREMEAQGNVVAELRRQYDGLVKSKGAFADETARVRLELTKEQKKLAEIKAELEAAKPQVDMSGLGVDEEGHSILLQNRLAFAKSAVGNFGELASAFQSQSGGFLSAQEAADRAAGEVARLLTGGQLKLGGSVNVNIYSSDAGESMRGTTRALEQAGLVGGR